MDHDSRKIPSPQAMKAISDDIAQKYAPTHASRITEIVILPVDPYHLHAYWALDDAKISLLDDGKAGELILRVHWLPEGERGTTASKLWFDIPVAPLPKRKQVTLPMDATWYVAEIGLRDGHHQFKPFACSNVIHVPRARMAATSAQETATERKVRQTLVPARPSTEAIYDESFIDAQIKRTLAEKNLHKIRALLPAPSSAPKQSGIYDEMKIDAAIQAVLRQKGISISLETSTKSVKDRKEKSSSGLGINSFRP